MKRRKQREEQGKGHPWHSIVPSCIGRKSKIETLLILEQLEWTASNFLQKCSKLIARIGQILFEAEVKDSKLTNFLGHSRVDHSQSPIPFSESDDRYAVERARNKVHGDPGIIPEGAGRAIDAFYHTFVKNVTNLRVETYRNIDAVCPFASTLE